MKDNLHPAYKTTTVRCACGNTFEVGSTKENMRVVVCSKCHPFYSGKQTMIKAGGRAEKFNKKYNLG